MKELLREETMTAGHSSTYLLCEERGDALSCIKLTAEFNYDASYYAF